MKKQSKTGVDVKVERTLSTLEDLEKDRLIAYENSDYDKAIFIGAVINKLWDKLNDKR